MRHFRRKFTNFFREWVPRLGMGQPRRSISPLKLLQRTSDPVKNVGDTLYVLRCEYISSNGSSSPLTSDINFDMTTVTMTVR